MSQEEFSNEKKILDIFIKLFKKIFYLIIVIIGYLQAYDYIKDKFPASIEIQQSKFSKTQYKTYFEFINKNSAIEKGDLVNPIEIILSDSVNTVWIRKDIQKKFGINFKIKKNVIAFNFDLVNKNERFNFWSISKKAIKILDVKHRIKDVEQINFYHFKDNPKPIYKVLNFWLLTLFIAIVLFIDSLLVILKDKKLNKMKSFVVSYPLTIENKTDFLNQYRNLYNNYDLRFKTPASFFIDFKINNLLNSFHNYDQKEVDLIKFATNWYTEIFILYRFRTIFIIISPILFIK